MKNYTFIKPYKTTIGSKDADALLMGASPFQEINFKIGDKINGTPFGGVDTNRVVETRVGNVNLNIPPEYLKEEAVNQPVSVKPTTKDVKQQNLQLEKIGDVLTAEDKFYESLGIKYHNTHMFGRPSRTKGRLLVAVVLVAGYFAYKKFKK
jgi:hypothetical protein